MTAADSVSRVDEQLRAEMVEAQAQVARWTTEQKQIVDGVALQSQRKLEDDKENLQQLEQELAGTQASNDTLQQRAREEDSQLGELRSELERLTAQEGLLPPEQQRISKTLEQQRQLLTQRERAYQQVQVQKDQKLSELEKGCNLYRAMLALEFERVGEERLRLIFTNIDSRAPSRSFSFQVFVDGGDKYLIEHCEPMVIELGTLSESLNATNDFSVFVRGMRRAFKQSCA